MDFICNWMGINLMGNLLNWNGKVGFEVILIVSLNVRIIPFLTGTLKIRQ